ncbi:PepSY domain-containing protein [Cupriavidus sp. BIC8F]|uniref:PepSY domain-containing protein n=1 Tax=Cupriavidus sp. BIC8F TaxID=3079014 RepID=UPI0029161AFF|nr:PepSY domain-containing protein [Cupriavidus sp. BIC8F]
MIRKPTMGTVVGAFAVGFGLLGGGYAVAAGGTQTPSYSSSIKVDNHDHGEKAEAARLATLARIDAVTATAAALAKVPGTAHRVALDNENGNLVYSVEVKTPAGELKDVKVDAGNGQVLHVDTGGDEEDEES